MIRITDDIWVNPSNVESVEVRTGGVRIVMASGGMFFVSKHEAASRAENLDLAGKIATAIAVGVDVVV